MKISRPKHYILLVCLLIGTIHCTKAQDRLLETYRAIEPVRNQQNSQLSDWQDYFFSLDECKCVYGSEFFVSVKEVDSQSKNLMIALQGGGACWPGIEQCKPELGQDDVYTASFSTDLAAKLGGDWNQLVIPYCDGSVYFGDTKADYDENGAVDHWHWGLRNSLAGLNLAYKKFPNAEKVFITGCSAGGYGTIINTRLIRSFYPDAEIYVLNESGPGLLKPETDFWNTIDAAWNLDQLIPADDCPKCEGQLIYWYDALLKDPKIKIGLYSSYYDRTLSKNFLKIPPEEFKTLLVSSTGVLNERYPSRFKRFFADNDSHCIDDRNYEVDGVRYWDWVMAFMKNEDTWKDILE